MQSQQYDVWLCLCREDTEMKPKPTKEQAKAFWRELGQGYLTRKQLSINSRLARSLCEHYPKHFMSCQKGYSLTRDAPVQDIEQSIGQMRSQAAKMNKRADALEKVLFERKQVSGF